MYLIGITVGAGIILLACLSRREEGKYRAIMDSLQ